MGRRRVNYYIYPSIRVVLFQNRISNQEIVRRTGFNKGYVSRCINRRHPANKRVIQAIADILKVPKSHVCEPVIGHPSSSINANIPKGNQEKLNGIGSASKNLEAG